MDKKYEGRNTATIKERIVIALVLIAFSIPAIWFLISVVNHDISTIETKHAVIIFFIAWLAYFFLSIAFKLLFMPNVKYLVDIFSLFVICIGLLALSGSIIYSIFIDGIKVEIGEVVFALIFFPIITYIAIKIFLKRLGYVTDIEKSAVWFIETFELDSDNVDNENEISYETKDERKTPQDYGLTKDDKFYHVSFYHADKKLTTLGFVKEKPSTYENYFDSVDWKKELILANKIQEVSPTLSYEYIDDSRLLWVSICNAENVNLANFVSECTIPWETSSFFGLIKNKIVTLDTSSFTMKQARKAFELFVKEDYQALIELYNDAN
ncbi:MAG: hypothetical protein OEY19_04865 [Gammaproteobacteria bacterium]|nr:hypothetical protein [Gammaproteobacteria bacterium]MDH5629699.1 hypothetical protein [Gammaproteobacteria bacterium]